MALEPTLSLTPVTLNLHITAACNYRCRFCFARFPDIPGSLIRDGWIQLIRQVASSPVLLGRYRIDKITFAGGEPTLIPWLPDLVACAKQVKLTTSLVTNGSLLSRDLLERLAPHLDWLGLSIDSPSEETNVRLGRGSGQHVETTLAAARLLDAYPRIRLKVNTVVTALNCQEDFHGLIHDLNPLRWKVLQATRVDDQNGADYHLLAASPAEFDAFCRRHADLHPVIEREDDVRGSYLMVDPAGRCFSSLTGRLSYSDPVLAVGLERAVCQVGWSAERFEARGGSYDWRSPESGDHQPEPRDRKPGRPHRRTSRQARRKALRLSSGSQRVAQFIDIENLCGRRRLDARQIALVRAAYEAVVPMDPRDLVVIACDRTCALHVKRGWPGAHVVPTWGPDGADRALLRRVTSPEVLQRFRTIYIASGDHIFTDAVRVLRRQGKEVIVVARPHSLATILRRMASRVIYFAIGRPINEAS